MQKNVTIRDVAQYAGVSISTVSRVINQSGSVNAALAARVDAAIAALEYRPNEIARSLKRNNSGLIAFVVSDTTDQYFTQISSAIEQAILPCGYHLIVCSTNASAEQEQALLRSLLERHVDGIILNTAGSNDAFIAQLSHSVPIVLCNRSIQAADFRGDFADFDNTSGVAELTRHLLRLGHKKIGILNGPQHISTARERYQGFLLAMRTVRGGNVQAYPFESDQPFFSMEEGCRAAAALLESPDPPTAIIAANGEFALGALHYCREHHIHIPDELSLVCFGNIPFCDLLYVRLTYAQMDLTALGNRIAALLMERIQAPDDVRINRELRFPTQFIPGESSALCPK